MQQALIVLTNIVLVLALAPAAAVAAPPASGTLAAYRASLPGFFAQAGAFTASQRAVCFASKAAQFGAIGSLTSAVGQAMTIALVRVRTEMDPDNAPTVQLAPVMPTAAAYAVFMGASSNTRYQLVNTLEARLLPALPGGASVQTAVSFVGRTLNNYIGSANCTRASPRVPTSPSPPTALLVAHAPPSRAAICPPPLALSLLPCAPWPACPLV